MFSRLLDQSNAYPLTPESAKQSITNPIQPDRLPDTSRLEIEYPSYQLSPAQNQYTALRALGIALFVIMVASYIDTWLTLSCDAGVYFLSFAAAICSNYFLIIYPD